MARNRQRAKERKQAKQRDPDLGLPDDAPGSSIFPSLGGGAPPTDLGSVRPVDFDDDDDDGAIAVEDEAPEVATPEPRKKGGVRVVAFIKACWAELQRVQWPDRKQVGQATAVVLGFVVIAGAFLGLADVVAQRIVNFII
jgi:preprotein translocase SecE subunit